jgi:predicted transcriptional regulator
MTQYQVSLLLGVQQSYVHRWETGMHVPRRIAHIEKVLEFLMAQAEKEVALG